jgi:hypothetical protein
MKMESASGGITSREDSSFGDIVLLSKFEIIFYSSLNGDSLLAASFGDNFLVIELGDSVFCYCIFGDSFFA